MKEGVRSLEIYRSKGYSLWLALPLRQRLVDYSGRPPSKGWIAQMEEHWFGRPEVSGSSPGSVKFPLPIFQQHKQYQKWWDFVVCDPEHNSKSWALNFQKTSRITRQGRYIITSKARILPGCTIKTVQKNWRSLDDERQKPRGCSSHKRLQVGPNLLLKKKYINIEVISFRFG